MDPIIINFVGYWLYPDISGIPNKSGIFCVYECTHDQPNNRLVITRLLYIGEAEYLRVRIHNHEKRDLWKSQVRPENQICYSYALVDPVIRRKIEAAMIFEHKPLLNEEFQYSFPFPTMNISSAGNIFYLHKNFTVGPS